MNKILLIIEREYLTRVKKKSFIVMTILGPLLMASVMIVPIIISSTAKETFVIEVLDKAGLDFKNSEKLIFEKSNLSFSEAKSEFGKNDYYAILFIPESIMTDASGVVMYSKKEVNISVKEKISTLIEQQLYSAKLASRGIERSVLDSLKTEVSIKTLKITDEGVKTSSTEAATLVGFLGGFLIYFFIFLYGMQVMRGVMEEKTNRIVEVIISSVKPFQLMMGKILGIALVGLTQFLLWVALTFGIYSIAMTVVFNNKDSKEKVKMAMEQRAAMSGGMQKSAMTKEFSDKESQDEISNVIQNINFTYIISVFIFYFLGGYLLYSALFAAIGSAVDHDSDTQQFMLPITIPLILAFVVAQSVVTTNPDSSVAFWFSIIPFTSPIVMMVRLPFGVPVWELALSMVLLVGGFIFTTWIAAKIYRTGILMYGKKVTYKELAKWLFYKG